MSVSYEIPNFEHTDSGIVHSRPLGTKVGGLYQNVSWSEVALQGVPIDTTLNLEVQDKVIDSCLPTPELLSTQRHGCRRGTSVSGKPYWLDLNNQSAQERHIWKWMTRPGSHFQTLVSTSMLKTPEICIKGLGSDYGKGSKPKHVKGVKPTYEHTGRPVPQTKSKKYQTKPRIKSKEHRAKHAKHDN
jgi:hypothetical protein